MPLPLPTSFGGRDAYVDQLVVMLTSSDPSLFLYPAELADFATAAADKRGVAARDWDSLGEIEPGRRQPCRAPASMRSPTSNIQLGSTRFPHGVAVTHRVAARQSARPRHQRPGPGDRSLHQLAALVP